MALIGYIIKSFAFMGKFGSISCLWAILGAILGGCGGETNLNISPKPSSISERHYILFGVDTIDLIADRDTLRWYEIPNQDTIWMEDIQINRLKTTPSDSVLVDYFQNYYDGNFSLFLDTTPTPLNLLVLSKYFGEVQADSLEQKLQNEFTVKSSKSQFDIRMLRFEFYCKEKNCWQRLTHPEEAISEVGSQVPGTYVVLKYISLENSKGHRIHVYPEIGWKIV